MPTDTRELFLDTAEALFAERGFYGVSIAAIADEHGLTKQALLHHFGSKEKLYGEVLIRISARFEILVDEVESETTDPIARLTSFFATLQSQEKKFAAQTRLLMRELLDNQHRANSAATWYLKPFLEHLIAMVHDVPGWADSTEAQALAVVYQWLGAVNYFAVSGPTLSGIFGKKNFEQMTKAYPQQLETLIISSLKAPPS